MKQKSEIWTDKFSVGINRFDRDHKKLLGLIFKLQDSVMQKEPDNSIIKETLDELADYTDYHFSAEQKLMEEYEYDRTEGHIAQHRAFIEKVNEFISRHDTRNGEVNREMLLFLKDWLVRHILRTDKEYCSFLKSVGYSENR